MSEGSGRGPIVVLAVVAVVVVLLFVAGVTLGGGGTGDGGWQERLAGLGAGGVLAGEDLVLTAGDCAVAGTVIAVGGSCAFDVAPEGGRFSLAPTRRATLVAVDAGLRLVFTVEDQRISIDVDPGDSADLTFSRSGGALALACLGAFACEARLLPPE